MKVYRKMSKFAGGIQCHVFIKCVLLITLIIASKYLLSKTSLRSMMSSKMQPQESWFPQPVQNPLESTKVTFGPSLLKRRNTHPKVNPYQPHKTEELIKGLHANLLEVLRSETARFDSCLLLDFPLHENKGDSAISVGELNALYASNLTVVNAYEQLYGEKGKAKYKTLQQDLNPKQTVILATGGGNIGAWSEADKLRAPAMTVFKHFKYVILSQSVHFFNMAHQTETRDQYATHGHVTILLRDETSFNFTRQYLKPVKPVQAPDMAFGLGPVYRYFSPSLDVIWINRADKEKGVVCKPKFPDHITYLVSDWVRFSSPAGQSIVENMYMKTHNGFLFLQRAKVVVTDRLHGYIMSTLLDIPVVIIDNKLKKLTNFRNTWTAGKDHAVVAQDCQDAVVKAMSFLGTVRTMKAPGF